MTPDEIDLLEPTYIGGVLCTLPSPFRPATSQSVTALCAQVSGGQGVCRIDVNANACGQVPEVSC